MPEPPRVCFDNLADDAASRPPPLPPGAAFSVAAMILVVLTPVTCGLTALPAIVCAVIAVCRHEPRGAWRVAVVAAGLGLALPVFLVWSVVRPDLPAWTPGRIHWLYARASVVGPAGSHLPAAARGIRFGTGGLFGKHTELRFEVDEAAADRYFRDLGAEPRLTIGPGSDDMQVVEVSSKWTVLNGAPSRAALEALEKRLLVVVEWPRIPWWTPTRIRRGWACEKKLGDAEDIEVYYDRDAGVLYVRWHDS